MGNVKRKILNFLPCENKTLEIYLENMALDGWKLEGITGKFFKFIKIEPAELKYSIDVIDSISFLEGNNSVQSLEYREYCKMAGWNFVCEVDKIQIFCAEKNTKTIDMHTDSKVEENILFKSSMKYLGLELMVFLLLLSNAWMLFVNSQGDSLADNTYLALIILIFCDGIYILDSIIILVKWKKYKFVRNHETIRRKNTIYFTVILGVSISMISAMCLDGNSGMIIPLIAGIVLMNVLIEIYRKKKLKNKKVKMVLVYIISMFIMIGACMISVFSEENPNKGDATLKIQDFIKDEAFEEKDLEVQKNSFLRKEKSILASKESNLIEGKDFDIIYNLFQSNNKKIIEYKTKNIEKNNPDFVLNKFRNCKIYNNIDETSYYLINENKVLNIEFYESSGKKQKIIEKIYDKLFLN